MSKMTAAGCRGSVIGRRAAISASASSTKPGARARRGDPARQVIHVGGEVAHVGHAHRIGEEAEHRRVVGQNRRRRRSGRGAPRYRRRTARAIICRLVGELVVVAEPAVDVDRAHLGVRAVLLEDLHDAQDIVVRQRRARPRRSRRRGRRRTIGLVGGDARARHLAPAPRRAPSPAGACPRRVRPRSARSVSVGLRALSSCHIQKAPFSPPRRRPARKRAIRSHQPAGRPVTGITRNPAFSALPWRRRPQR